MDLVYGISRMDVSIAGGIIFWTEKKRQPADDQTLHSRQLAGSGKSTTALERPSMIYNSKGISWAVENRDGQVEQESEDLLMVNDRIIHEVIISLPVQVKALKQ